MSDNAGDGSVNSSIGGTSVNGASATSGVTAELKNEIQKMIMGIVKDAVPRVVKQSMEQSIPTLLDKIAEQAIQGEPTTQAAPVASTPDSGERLTMKALQAQVDQLQKALKSQQEAAQQAAQQAKDTKLRSDFQGRLAAKIGADNPMLPLLLDSLYDKNKRVVEGANGVPLMKFVNNIGEEEFKTLDEGVSALFETELKGLINPSRAQQLPYAGYINRGQQNPIGQPMPTPTNQNGNGRPNPLLMGVAEALSETRPEAAQIIASDAMKLSQQAPTPRK